MRRDSADIQLFNDCSVAAVLSLGGLDETYVPVCLFS